MISLQKATAGRAELAVDVVGDGAPIVFLHAGVCDRRMWRAQLNALGGSNRAIAYDRRGFGETCAEPEDHSSVADLRAVIDAVAGGAPAVLVGCSQGGRVALDAALAHPSAYSVLVLISPNVTGAPSAELSPEIEEMVARQTAAERAGDLALLNAIRARLLLDGPLAPEGRVTGAARDLFTEMYAGVQRAAPVGTDRDIEPIFDRLGEIAIPSLVISGDFEFPHIQARCRQIAPMLPKGSHQTLPGGAHLPSLDQPDQVTAMIRAFIKFIRDAG